MKAFMDAMQFGTQVEGEEGHMSARLTWPGPPEASAIEPPFRDASRFPPQTAT